MCRVTQSRATARFEIQTRFVANAAVLAKYPAIKPNTITLSYAQFFVTKYESSSASTSLSSKTAEEVKDWIIDLRYPLLGQMEPDSKAKWASYPQRPLVMVFIDAWITADYRAETKTVYNRLAEVAKQFEGQVTFAIRDTNSDPARQELKDYKLTDDDRDVRAVYLGLNAVDKYVMDEDTELAEFVELAQAQKIKRYIKSEPAPKSQKPGSVITVVGTTFNELVTQPDADVLVEFYAPWCGHCKALEPKYKKLAKKLKGVDGIVIAKLDATANDYPPFYQVSGFPTIYLAKKGEKSEPILYDGAREVKDFLKFLRKMSSAPIPAPKKKKKNADVADTADTAEGESAGKDEL